MWAKDQDPLQRKSNVTCQVPCSCGYVYIGEVREPTRQIKDDRAQGSYKKGWLGEISHCRACLEPPSPGRLGQNQGVWQSSKYHHIIHQRSRSTSPTQTRIHWRTDEGITISNCWTAILAMPNLWWGWHQAPTSWGMMTSSIMAQMRSGSRKKAKVEAKTQD